MDVPLRLEETGEYLTVGHDRNIVYINHYWRKDGEWDGSRMKCSPEQLEKFIDKLSNQLSGLKDDEAVQITTESDEPPWILTAYELDKFICFLIMTSAVAGMKFGGIE